MKYTESDDYEGFDLSLSGMMEGIQRIADTLQLFYIQQVRPQCLNSTEKYLIPEIPETPSSV
jgi:hypothetical protein